MLISAAVYSNPPGTRAWKEGGGGRPEAINEEVGGPPGKPDCIKAGEKRRLDSVKDWEAENGPPPTVA